MTRPLTLPEVAEHLSCSVRTVEREIAAGRLPVLRVRGLRRVDPGDLAAYLAQSRRVQCQSASDTSDGKSEYRSAMVAALSALSQPEPPRPTRSRSKLRCAAARSRLHLVSSPTG
jgi:excisionase family DNA binding protein